jgi:anti-sigma regulatory factor (Ser/Thr protein kinase)
VDGPQPRRVPAVDGYRLVLTTSFAAAQVATVRRQVAHAVEDRGLSDDAAEGFVIAVHEVMTNAVRHGGGSGRLRLWADGDVVCEVSDEGGGFVAMPYVDRVERPQATSAGGMGLWIAQQTTDAMTIESGSSGTTVRMITRRPG